MGEMVWETQCECEWEKCVGKHSVSVNGRNGLGKITLDSVNVNGRWIGNHTLSVYEIDV